MNDIDTAAVRAEYEVGLWPNAGTCRVIGELCDALDEARSLINPDTWALFMDAGIQQARAEAAEAERDDYEAACNSYRKQVARLNVDLDEARAERDGWKLAAGHRMELLIEREERAEAAEARIAAALDLADRLWNDIEVIIRG